MPPPLPPSPPEPPDPLPPVALGGTLPPAEKPCCRLGLLGPRVCFTAASRLLTAAGKHELIYSRYGLGGELLREAVTRAVLGGWSVDQGPWCVNTRRRRQRHPHATDHPGSTFGCQLQTPAHAPKHGAGARLALGSLSAVLLGVCWAGLV